MRAVPRLGSLLMVALCALAQVGCGSFLGGTQKTPNAENAFVSTDGAHPMPLLDGVSAMSVPADVRLSYNGGPVISNVKVVQVLFGQGTYAPEVTGPQFGAFYQAITNGSPFEWLTEYNTDVVGGNQKIGFGSFAGQVTITPQTVSGTQLSDSQIQAELNAQITAGDLPAPDNNTIYMVNFPAGYKISLGGLLGGNSCQSGGFCAYHSSFSHQDQRVAYAVLPDMSAGSGCEAPHCGNDPVPYNNFTSVASHELTEAVTDVAVSQRHIAWYQGPYGEIGDLCNGELGTFVGPDGVTYTAQREFSNRFAGCILLPDGGTSTTPPPPDAGN